jgi:hypothetical protein
VPQTGSYIPVCIHNELLDLADKVNFQTMFHFHRDEEGLAWRLIGQVARMCIELGLHRRDALFKALPDDEERSSAVNLFWAVYVLDRRWSFGTGMPFAIQDSDIDPTLPEPVRLLLIVRCTVLTDSLCSN